MDFFHVMYWANDAGRYIQWTSFYPPINFLFMKVVHWLLIGPMQFSDGFAIRDYSSAARLFVVALYLAIPAGTMMLPLWSGFTPLQRVLIYMFVVLSAPVLFGLERGNLVIFSMLVAGMALSWDGWRRATLIALLINIKPYFAILLLAPLVTGFLIEFFVAVMLAGSIFIFTGLLLDPNFLAFLGNLLAFSGNEAAFSGREVLALPQTITAMAYAANIFDRDGVRFQLLGFTLANISAVIILVNWVIVAGAVAALAAAGRRVGQRTTLGILLVVVSNLGVWVGGYSLIVFPLLVPAFWVMRGRWLYVGLVIAILLPLDSIVLYSDEIPGQVAYLSGEQVTVVWQLGLGVFLRPILNCLLLLALTIEIVSYLVSDASARLPMKVSSI